MPRRRLNDVGVWVVEMFDDKSLRWVPEGGSALTRDNARTIMHILQDLCPSDKFRLTWYTRP